MKLFFLSIFTILTGFSLQASPFRAALETAMPIMAIYSTGRILANAQEDVKGVPENRRKTHDPQGEIYLRKHCINDEFSNLMQQQLFPYRPAGSGRPLRFLIEGYAGTSPLSAFQTSKSDYIAIHQRIVGRSKKENYIDLKTLYEDIRTNYHFALDHEMAHLHYNDTLNISQRTINSSVAPAVAGCLANGLLLAQKNMKLISNRGLMGRLMGMAATMPLAYLAVKKAQIESVRFIENRADAFAIAQARKDNDPERIEWMVHFCETHRDYVQQVVKDELARYNIVLSDAMLAKAAVLYWQKEEHLEPSARAEKLRKVAEELRSEQR